MLLAILIWVQAGEAPLGDAQAFDLARLPAEQRCDAQSPADILVCASRSLADRQRLSTLPDDQFAERPARAEVSVGSGTLGATVEQHTLPGAVSNRVMVKLKLPF